MNEITDIALPEAVRELEQSVADLQRRVTALEGAAHAQPVKADRSGGGVSTAPAAEAAPPSAGTSALLDLGKAMLAVAGAYLLRALAESGAVPRMPVIAIALAYAFVWLAPASRARAWFGSAVWAATSAVILMPMLWEIALRFRFLPDAVIAVVLDAFVLAAMALAWKRRFALVASIAAVAGSVAAVALAIATRDPAPFTSALVVMALAGEVAAALDRALPVRPVVAAAADLAVFALVWIYSSPAAARAEYAPIRAAALLSFGPALLLVYAASASVQTLLERRRISAFEVGQTLTAFLLASWTMFSFWSGQAAVLLGWLCLLSSGAGYAVSFGWFSRTDARRNYHVYATGSLALLVAGSFLCLPAGGTALLLSLCALVAVLLAGPAGSVTLRFHAVACLAAAAVAAGLPQWMARAMAGPLPASPGGAVWLVSACSVLGYLGLSRLPFEGGSPRWGRILRLAAAALAVGASAGLLVWVLVGVSSFAIVPNASHVAVIRTLVICALVLAMSWSGAVWQRKELVMLAWAALAFGASKLLFEDLRHGHLAFTAASLILYAFTLLLVPRMMRLKPA